MGRKYMQIGRYLFTPETGKTPSQHRQGRLKYPSLINRHAKTALVLALLLLLSTEHYTHFRFDRSATLQTTTKRVSHAIVSPT